MKNLLFVILLAAVTATYMPDSRAACCVQVSVSITPEGLRDPGKLNVRLTNNSTSPLEVYKADLPWGNRYSLILTAVHEAQPNTQLKQVFFLDDAGPDSSVIQPKQSLSGQIDVRQYFENFESELAKGSVIVLWSYRLVTVDKQESPRLSGWVRLVPLKGR